jgi:Niemann-Pick C1 protein
MDNLSAKEKMLPVPQRVALTMKHAGVSITVTSITDMAAFLIGSTTVNERKQCFALF